MSSLFLGPLILQSQSPSHCHWNILRLCTYPSQTLITSFLDYYNCLHFRLFFFSTHLINLLSELILAACHSSFRKLHWFPIFHHIKSNLFCLNFNTLSNLAHTTYPASFPMFFGPPILSALLESVCLSNTILIQVCASGTVIYFTQKALLPSPCLLKFTFSSRTRVKFTSCPQLFLTF